MQETRRYNIKTSPPTPKQYWQDSYNKWCTSAVNVTLPTQNSNFSVATKPNLATMKIRILQGKCARQGRRQKKSIQKIKDLTIQSNLDRAPLLLRAHKILRTENSPLNSTLNYCQTRHTASNCGDNKMALYRGWLPTVRSSVEHD
jgi:hypothetical protein